MKFVNRKSAIVNGGWLPDMDLNHDKQIQSLLCYRYTIGQKRASKVGFQPRESRTHAEVRHCLTSGRAAPITNRRHSRLPVGATGLPVGATNARQFKDSTIQRINAVARSRSYAPTL